MIFYVLCIIITSVNKRSYSETKKNINESYKVRVTNMDLATWISHFDRLTYLHSIITTGTFSISYLPIFVYLQTWPESGKHTITTLLVIPEQPMNFKLFKMIPIASCHVVKMALSVVLTFVLKYLTNYLDLCPWAEFFTKKVFCSNIKPIKPMSEHPRN